MKEYGKNIWKEWECERTIETTGMIQRRKGKAMRQKRGRDKESKKKKEWKKESRK